MLVVDAQTYVPEWRILILFAKHCRIALSVRVEASKQTFCLRIAEPLEGCLHCY
jgi:hypothetical protein